jgi:hypothetical protein
LLSLRKLERLEIIRLRAWILGFGFILLIALLCLSFALGICPSFSSHRLS